MPYSSLGLPASPPRAGELRARFMGVTTILLDDGETAILTDGFFSRPALGRVIVRKLASDPDLIDDAFREGHIERVAAVFVAHAHYDHAMDCAAVALRADALLIGSESVANIGRGAGIPQNRLRVINGGEICSFNRLNVTTYRTIHSPHAKFPDSITEPLSQPARVSAYQEGGCYSFLVKHDERGILIHPGANVLPGMYKGAQAEVVFLAIGTLGKQDDAFIEQYWREVVLMTGAKLVIPVHWDDFTIPLSEPLQPMPLLIDDFDRSMRWLLAAGKQDGVAVRLMPVFEPVDILRFA